MKVHLIKRQSIEAFVQISPQYKPAFEDWLTKIRYADWYKPEDITRTFGSVDFLGNGSSRVIFNVAGNSCRVICKYVFGGKQVHLFVCWIGIHADYTKLCRGGEQYFVNKY
ncbi:type II toxin-antitoxin system HigB family toxin [Dyadobacter sp. CY343]|uniref:type II toxin-antitoxin system HigB family toxin n=1 Tax=Dyadobacter sp. CY343 TaxID=2907299 RepID=UPI001F2CF4ED|nr:type II toxin-antitoxin system HigB family toxin [Dyadobacter sp. CY343]MCE7062434.1 type II toxin-antitoxin system HigB family toxin [Dyadobacter sp. CY343]